MQSFTSMPVFPRSRRPARSRHQRTLACLMLAAGPAFADCNYADLAVPFGESGLIRYLETALSNSSQTACNAFTPLVIQSSGTLEILGTLTNYDTFNPYGQANNIYVRGFLVTGPSGTIINNGEIISWEGSIVNNGEFINNGRLDSGAFLNNQRVVNRGNFINRYGFSMAGGTFQNEATATFLSSFESRGAVINSGTLVVDAYLSQILNVAGGSITNTNTGTMRLFAYTADPYGDGQGGVFNNFGTLYAGMLFASAAPAAAINLQQGSFFHGGVHVPFFARQGNDGTFFNENTSTVFGTFDNGPNGTLISTSDFQLGIRQPGGAGTTMSNQGQIIVDAASTFNANGILTNNNLIRVQGASVFNNGAGTVPSFFERLDNSGQLIINPDSKFNNLSTLNNGGTLDNQGTFTNFGTLNNVGEIAVAGTFRNIGTLTNNSGGRLASSVSSGSIFENDGSIANEGEITAVAGTFRNNGTLTNLASATLASSGIFISQGRLVNGGTLTNTGTMTNLGYLRNEGVLDSSATFSNYMILENAGRLSASGVFDNYGTITNAGEFSTSQATFSNLGTLNNSNLQPRVAYVQGSASPTVLILGSFVNDGVVTNATNGEFSVRGAFTNKRTLSNSGQMYFDGPMTVSELGVLTNEQSGVLNAGGSIQNLGSLTNGGQMSIAGALTNVKALTNAVGATLRAGSVVLNNGQLNNFGQVRMDGDLVNSGLLLNAAGAELTLAATVRNDHSILNSGSMLINGRFIHEQTSTLKNLPGGVITVAAGGRLELFYGFEVGTGFDDVSNQGTLVVGPVGVVENGHRFDNYQGTINIVSGSAFSNGGTVSGGSIRNDGTLYNTEGQGERAMLDSAYSGIGVVRNSSGEKGPGFASVMNLHVKTASGEWFNGLGSQFYLFMDTNRFYVDQQFTDLTGLDIYNDGDFYTYDYIHFGKPAAGTWHLGPQGTLNLRYPSFVDSGNVFNGGGTIRNEAGLTINGALNWTASPGSLVYNGDTLTLAGTGPLAAQSASLSTHLARVENRGLFIQKIYSSLSLTASSDTFENHGEARFETGALVNAATGARYRQIAGATSFNGRFVGGSVSIEGGRFCGSGDVSGTTVTGGTVCPGNSPGSLHVHGDLDFQFGTLEIEIAGLAEGLFDRLLIDGAANFAGGVLSLKFLDGYMPAKGEHWNFLVADGGVSGLANLSLSIQGLPDGYAFNVVPGDDGVVLNVTAVAAVPEPAAWMNLAAGITLLAASTLRQRRRFRKHPRSGSGRPLAIPEMPASPGAPRA